MAGLRTPVGEPGLRQQATSRLQKKRELRAHLLAYLLFNGALVAIWALTGASFFWPAIPLLIWGIGLVFHAWTLTSGPSTRSRSSAR